MENVMKQFEFCQKFGIKIIRLFASHIPAKYVDDSFFDRVINNLIIVSDMAKEMDIMVALENHGGITGTSDDCLRILRGVNRENIGLNYDAANFVPCNQDPVDAVRILKDYIFHVHLKDVVFTNNGKLEGWEFCTFGDGKINYIEIFNILSSYDGFYSIECEGKSGDRVASLVKAKRELEKLLSGN